MNAQTALIENLESLATVLTYGSTTAVFTAFALTACAMVYVAVRA